MKQSKKSPSRVTFSLYSDLLDRDRDVLAVDRPILGDLAGCAGEGIGKRSVTDLLFITGDDLENLLASGNGRTDVIHHVEVCILAHRLNLGDDLADEALLDQFGCEVRVQCDNDAAILCGEVARLLLDVDEQICLGELDLFAAEIKVKSTVVSSSFFAALPSTFASASRI